jgi:membrane-bound lytic murein transglycosylase B
MVNFALPLAALAITASVAAAPAASPAEVSVRTSNSTTFSFEQWAEDIIANPDTALSVDEAVAAAQAADVVGSAGGLKKKAICDQEIVNWKRAPVCHPFSLPTRYIYTFERTRF